MSVFISTNVLICLRAYIPDDILLHILSVLLFQERFSSTVTPRVLPWKTCFIGLLRIVTTYYWLVITNFLSICLVPIN